MIEAYVDGERDPTLRAFLGTAWREARENGRQEDDEVIGGAVKRWERCHGELAEVVWSLKDGVLRVRGYTVMQSDRPATHEG